MKTNEPHCEEIQQLLLLEETGELTEEKRRQIEVHLESCAECSQYRIETAAMLKLGRQSLPGGLPSSQTVRNIIDHAGRRNGEIVFFTRPWRIAAGIAAVFAVILGTYLTVNSPSGKSDNAAFEAGDLNVMLSLAEEGEWSSTATEPNGSDEAQLKELAGRLLKMQGFSIEENEESEDVIDLFLPTALQLRNTPGSPAETSV